MICDVVVQLVGSLNGQRGLALLLALVLMAASALAADVEGGPSDFDAATGFRVARYRAPVPAEVPGGKRIGVEDIDDLTTTQGAVLVDVMPADGAGLDATTGHWNTKRHDNIPGSTWLPNVGKGHIETRIEVYFRDNLARLTGGDKTRPIIIYCQSDCWMGWNAVQRAAGFGYSALYWYPDGIDGWRDWDRTFARAEPVAVWKSERGQRIDN
ncbi:MAG: rhodanese-like domain-containing protein [Hyphomicrobiaceae bacterium]|nr:rhodanese-like domain-containing protein [Hyphomicrobiaceae bacterium]